MKLADRVQQLEMRLAELERRPAPSVQPLPNRRVEAARIAGKRSAEVRRSKSGSAQPKPRTIVELSEPEKPPNAAPGPVPNDSRTPPPTNGMAWVQACRAVLDDPNECRARLPFMTGQLRAVMIAWTAPFGVDVVRIGSSPETDPDLRAILEAFAAGYTIDQLELAGTRCGEDEALRAEDSPGPSSFTLAVLDRLVGPPGRA